jgi:fructose-specific phosphotransferase system IIC component
LSDDLPEKPVVSSSLVEWIWIVKPTSVGKQSLVVFISVPVIIDKAHDFISARPLKNIPLEIIIGEQEVATPTATASPLPPIQRIGEKLIEGSPIVLGAIFTLVVGLVTAYVTYVTSKNKVRKNADAEKSGNSKPRKSRRK